MKNNYNIVACEREDGLGWHYSLTSHNMCFHACLSPSRIFHISFILKKQLLLLFDLIQKLKTIDLNNKQITWVIEFNYNIFYMNIKNI